jgi:Flp pilus assembly protein TadG
MLLGKQFMARRNILRDRSGGSAVEFAILAPILIFVLISIFELGILALMSSALDNAINDVSRLIRTGQSPGPVSAASFKDMVCTRMGGNVADCMGRMKVSVEQFSRFTDANLVATTAPNDTFNKGGANDIIVVKADYTWPLISPMLAPSYPSAGPFQVTISSRAAFKNEPFS